MLLLVLLLVPADACDTPTRASDVAEATGRAEVAWTTMDAGGLEQAVADTRTDLGCLGEALSVDEAAAVHRAEALGAFLAGDNAGATGHFAAVRAAMPGWKLPSTLAPEGHPLQEVFDAALPSTERVPLPITAGTTWCAVDGTRAEDVPADRPFVLQCFDTVGAVRSTRMATRDDLAQPLPVEPMPEPVEHHKDPRTVRLAISAGVLAVGSGAAFAVSAYTHQKYWDVTTPPEHLHTLQIATNTGIVAGGVLGAAALGCATGAVLTGRF